MIPSAHHGEVPLGFLGDDGHVFVLVLVYDFLLNFQIQLSVLSVAILCLGHEAPEYPEKAIDKQDYSKGTDSVPDAHIGVRGGRVSLAEERQE